jgi:hypothetical protein
LSLCINFQINPCIKYFVNHPVANFKDYIAVEVQATTFDVLPTVANGQELEIDEYRVVVSVEK